MRTVLVTGAAGFVGRHLLRELDAAGMSILAISGPAAPPADGTPGSVTWQQADLTDPEQVNTIDFSQLDAVVHLAGLSAVGPSFDQPLQYASTNIGMETNLFEAARAQDASPTFLIVSSGSLYSPVADLPLTETSVVIPSSPYAVSKIGQEAMAQYYQGRGFNCIIARPFNHIGPGQGTGFIVPDLAKQMVAAEGHTAKVLVGNLDAKRDYTDVRDIARAYRLLLQKGQPGQTYNICSGQALSGHDILAGLAAAGRYELSVEQDPSRLRPSDNPVVYGDHTKLTEHTGWQPEIPLITTLADVLADWRHR